MVTASCRIGYDFSTPDGPLTMKLAETPSRSAGLIISVFGVASSPMASLPPAFFPARREAMGEEATPKTEMINPALLDGVSANFIVKGPSGVGKSYPMRPGSEEGR